MSVHEVQPDTRPLCDAICPACGALCQRHQDHPATTQHDCINCGTRWHIEGES